MQPRRGQDGRNGQADPDAAKTPAQITNKRELARIHYHSRRCSSKEAVCRRVASIARVSLALPLIPPRSSPTLLVVLNIGIGQMCQARGVAA
jgi:hypothetical protein